MRHDPTATVTPLAQRIADHLGLELVDVEPASGDGRAVIRVLVDREGGVSVEDCANFSEMLSRQLDIEEPLPYAYTLEVASPGLDRPLRKAADFARFAAQLVRITVTEAAAGAPAEQRNFKGRLLGFRDDRVAVELEDGTEARFPLATIAQARLVVDPERIRQDLKESKRQRKG
ncbi:MAG: ribosome maturation factor RimP [Armatimonadetes bacterium]|nr:ribosome maturation factor RimP [Armatimonadota bacterium]